MSIGHINKIPIFKSNSNKKDPKQNSGEGSFIAGSAALGGAIGASVPKRYFIQTPDDITIENLNNLLNNPSKYSKKLGEKRAETLQNAIKSALSDFTKFTQEKGQNIGKKITDALLTENNSLKQKEKLEKIRESNFKNLKKLVPKEHMLKSAAKGTAIGGGIAFGIVVMSKILSQISPPETR